MTLASWNEGPARTAILDFVERVAVLDNDGTLWCERPTYIQLLFVFARLRDEVVARPELAEQPFVKALLAGDLAAAQQFGMEAIAGVLLELDAGRTHRGVRARRRGLARRGQAPALRCAVP